MVHPLKSVAVIIPVYNREHVIERAMHSVCQQTYPHFSLWVIDDGSTDQTKEVIRKFIHKQPENIKKKIHLLSFSENKGVSSARNAGITMSEEPWVAFLDSDDEWNADKLACQMGLLKDNPHHKIIHGEEIWVRKGVRVNPKKKHKKYGGDIFLGSLYLCLMSPSTILIARQVLEEVGLFKEHYPVCEDYDLWLRITSKYEVGYVERPIITKYGGHADQLSFIHRAQDYYRVLTLDELLQKKNLTMEKRDAIKNVLKKKCDILLHGYKKHGRKEKFVEVTKLMEKQGWTYGQWESSRQV